MLIYTNPWRPLTERRNSRPNKWPANSTAAHQRGYAPPQCRYPLGDVGNDAPIHKNVDDIVAVMKELSLQRRHEVILGLLNPRSTRPQSRQPYRSWNQHLSKSRHWHNSQLRVVMIYQGFKRLRKIWFRDLPSSLITILSFFFVLDLVLSKRDLSVFGSFGFLTKIKGMTQTKPSITLTRTTNSDPP